MSAPDAAARQYVRSLVEVFADPHALEPPQSAIPYLAWKERVSMLAAREKDGKSTLVAAGVSAVSRGGTFLDERCEQARVLWVSLEEHESDIARRFKTFGCDPEYIYLAEPLREAFADLDAAVSEVKPALVVVDTLAAFADLTGLVKEAGDSANWLTIMTFFTRLARESRAAILLLHHARKSDGKYRDSSAIGGGVDAILEMSAQSAERKIEGRGRWQVDALTVRLEGGQFKLVDGGISVADLVRRFIRANPGCSKRAVRDGVKRRAADVDVALDELYGSGELLDEGTGHEHAYRIPEVEGVSQVPVCVESGHTPNAEAALESPRVPATDTLPVLQLMRDKGLRSTVSEGETHTPKAGHGDTAVATAPLIPESVSSCRTA